MRKDLTEAFNLLRESLALTEDVAESLFELGDKDTTGNNNLTKIESTTDHLRRVFGILKNLPDREPTVAEAIQTTIPKIIVDNPDKPEKVEGMWNVWMEGFRATGESGPATFCGTFPGKTFAEACTNWNKEEGTPGYFNAKQLTYWGCCLYDNEIDARRSFG